MPRHLSTQSSRAPLHNDQPLGGSGAAKDSSARCRAAESSACSDTAPKHTARSNTAPQQPECGYTTDCKDTRCSAPEGRAASG